MSREIQTFDGLDNRRDIMTLLTRLGSNARRAKFIESLISRSLNGFSKCPTVVKGNCDVVTAYFMMISACNDLGVSINEGAKLLEEAVRKGG